MLSFVNQLKYDIVTAILLSINIRYKKNWTGHDSANGRKVK